VSNRREIWRDFMGRFEPSADPRDAVERGFYVPRPGRSLAEQLAARFELKPAASHLLVGGVGSGKTTQLLVARDRLEAHDDTRAVYVDLSRKAEPNRIGPADVLWAAGISLVRCLPGSQEPRLFKTFFDQASDSSSPENKIAAGLRLLLKELRQSCPNHILLVDSLDRMTDLESFASLVEGPLPTLRAMGVGVILIGPVTTLYGVSRTTLDRFDRIWSLPTVDFKNDAEGHSFLVKVLETRDAQHMLAPAAVERLATLSGGVLRDLIALTQTAGEEAYVDGADRVEVVHVETAAEIFGRKQLFAIDSQDLAVLQRVRQKGTFVQTSEKDLALLATRRVLEYGDGQARFAVHPTIEPLLAQIPEVA
jgi:Cdc6-like AAA superfamily ATPase